MSSGPRLRRYESSPRLKVPFASTPLQSLPLSSIPPLHLTDRHHQALVHRGVCSKLIDEVSEGRSSCVIVGGPPQSGYQLGHLPAHSMCLVRH
eukprot:3875400-Rhodomonas_salina.4